MSERSVLTIPFLLAMTLGLVTFELHGQTCDQVPTANDDAVEFRGEVALWIDVLANDHDLDGEEVSVVVGSNRCRGQASVDFGTLKLELPLDSTDSCSIDYRLRDSSGNFSPSATVTVTDLLIFGDRFDTTTLDWSECVGC